MPLVRVWNDNIYDYEDKREGIKIPAKESVTLDYDVAKEHLKKFHSPQLDANEQIDPRSYKMLRIDPTDLAKAKNTLAKGPSPKFVSMRTGETFESQEAFEAHLEKYYEDLADKDEKEKRLKKSGRPPKDDGPHAA
jgi:hypothetical protein